MEERFEELEERFEELGENDFILPRKPEKKSTKHQDVKLFVTSEKDNDTSTKQSSLKKFLAERDDKLKTPEQKVAAELASLKMASLEEDLSAKQIEVEELRTLPVLIYVCTMCDILWGRFLLQILTYPGVCCN